MINDKLNFNIDYNSTKTVPAAVLVGNNLHGLVKQWYIIVKYLVKGPPINPYKWSCWTSNMSKLMRLWYLSHRRPAKAQASLRIRAVSPEPSLFAHMKYGSRRRVQPKIRHLAPLDGCACAFGEWLYGGRKVPLSHMISYPLVHIREITLCNIFGAIPTPYRVKTQECLFMD